MSGTRAFTFLYGHVHATLIDVTDIVYTKMQKDGVLTVTLEDTLEDAFGDPVHLVHKTLFVHNATTNAVVSSHAQHDAFTVKGLFNGDAIPAPAPEPVPEPAPEPAAEPAPAPVPEPAPAPVPEPAPAPATE